MKVAWNTSSCSVSGFTRSAGEDGDVSGTGDMVWVSIRLESEGVTSVMHPHPETRHLARIFSEEIFFGRKKREEKEEIFEKLLLNFEICFGIKTN